MKRGRRHINCCVRQSWEIVGVELTLLSDPDFASKPHTPGYLALKEHISIRCVVGAPCDRYGRLRDYHWQLKPAERVRARTVDRIHRSGRNWFKIVSILSIEDQLPVLPDHRRAEPLMWLARDQLKPGCLVETTGGDQNIVGP